MLTSNDDSGSPDPRVRFRAPADGRFLAIVRDHLDRGGEDFAYTLQITPPYSGFSSRFQLRSRQALPLVDVPRGGRMAMVFRVSGGREGWHHVFRDLPEGITVDARPVMKGTPYVPVSFVAAADAPRAASRCLHRAIDHVVRRIRRGTRPGGRGRSEAAG